MASGGTVDFETGHTGPINDLKFDSLGRLLATASDDGTIKLFQVNAEGDEQPSPLQTLTGHTGPVWSVAWAPPAFGSYLASGSYDRSVRIWAINQNSYAVPAHTASVSAVAWAPAVVGMLLASGGLDGTVALTHWSASVNGWKSNTVSHGAPVLSLGWRAPFEDAPAASANDASATANSARAILASGGCDGRVVLWVQTTEGTEPSLTRVGCVAVNGGWVHAVAFPPTPWGGALVAGCSDGTVAFIVDNGEEVAEAQPAAAVAAKPDEGAGDENDPFKGVGEGGFGGFDAQNEPQATGTTSSGGWSVVKKESVSGAALRVAYGPSGETVTVAVKGAAESVTLTVDV